MLGFLGGTGPEGMGLALRLGLAGEPVFIGSRDAARAAAAAESLRAQGVTTEVQGGLNDEAAERAGTIVVAVPFEAQCDVLEPLRERLRGKTVVDTAVALTRTGGGFELLHVKEGSAALQAQALLPDSNLVAAFQTISARDLLDAPHPVEGDVVVCADDAAAKRLVMGLAERIPALRAVDGGSLAGSRYVEGLTPLLLNVNRLYRGKDSYPDSRNLGLLSNANAAVRRRLQQGAEVVSPPPQLLAAALVAVEHHHDPCHAASRGLHGLDGRYERAA